MSNELRHFVSPSFTHEKLAIPLYKDVVDVFEDRMLYWLLVPAKKLLRIKQGSIAAVALATNYVEGIEIYRSGEDSKGRSRQFFCRSFKRIFSGTDQPEYMQDAIAVALYDMIRCGFVHEAMCRSGITFASIRKEAFTVTWTKRDGRFDPKGQLLSAVVNPRRYVEAREIDLTNYVRELRARKPTPAKEKFLAAVNIKWQLGQPGPLIGMTDGNHRSQEGLQGQDLQVADSSCPRSSLIPWDMTHRRH